MAAVTICSNFAAAAAKSLQSCLTLCDPRDGSPPGSPVPGILQARTLEWVAISFSNAWKWKVKVESLSHAWLLATPWTAAHQAPPSMGFSRQEYWSGCYSAIKKNEIIPCAATWIDPEGTILSKISLTEKYHVISVTCGRLKKKKKRTNIAKQIERIHRWFPERTELGVRKK